MIISTQTRNNLFISTISSGVVGEKRKFDPSSGVTYQIQIVMQSSDQLIIISDLYSIDSS